METSERIDQLIATKNWNELTVDERAFVVDVLGSEEQYRAMRDVHFALLGTPKITTRPSIKTIRNLKTEFKRRRAVAWSPMAFITAEIPAYMGVAIAFGVAMMTWHLGRRSVDPQIKTATVYQVDTVFVASKPDTVFISKIVTVVKQMPVPADIARSEPAREKPASVNMKETEALENLLVSGSE